MPFNIRRAVPEMEAYWNELTAISTTCCSSEEIRRELDIFKN